MGQGRVLSLTSHQFNNVLFCLLEDHLDVELIAVLNLSLKVSTSMLVLAQIVDLSNQSFQAVLSESGAI